MFFFLSTIDVRYTTGNIKIQLSCDKPLMYKVGTYGESELWPSSFTQSFQVRFEEGCDGQGWTVSGWIMFLVIGPFFGSLSHWWHIFQLSESSIYFLPKISGYSSMYDSAFCNKLPKPHNIAKPLPCLKVGIWTISTDYALIWQKYHFFVEKISLSLLLPMHTVFETQ